MTPILLPLCPLCWYPMAYHDAQDSTVPRAWFACEECGYYEDCEETP